MLREVRRRAGDFDVIHFNVDLLPQALFHDLAHKCLVTLHGRLDLPDALPLYKAYPEMPLVSISNAQRRPMPLDANWLATIPHGLPPRVCPFSPNGGSYLAFRSILAAAEDRAQRNDHDLDEINNYAASRHLDLNAGAANAADFLPDAFAPTAWKHLENGKPLSFHNRLPAKEIWCARSQSCRVAAK